MRTGTIDIRMETPDDLVKATALGVRLELKRWRGKGLDDAAIRRLVIERYRLVLHPEDHDEYERETLMATVQRTLDESLATARPDRPRRIILDGGQDPT